MIEINNDTVLINTQPVFTLDWVDKATFCKITGISPNTIHNRRAIWQAQGEKFHIKPEGSKDYIYSLKGYY